MIGPKPSTRYFITILMMLAVHCVCSAQFYTAGDDPASTRWNRTETGNYRIIYPRGLDSLAMSYGRKLEHYRLQAGRSAGFVPGENIRGKMPVVLHAFNANSNGSVAWAPKRMDLFTSPQPYAPEAMPWIDMLAIHEQRHAAQMQAGISGGFRPFGWIFGEMFNGLVAGLWSYTWFLEGDAVVAETALSNSGRGRTADFMNYYMIAFDNGDFRNWNRWKFGSQRNYTPNHYAAGYLMIGGIRYRYGYSNISGDYSRHISRNIYDFDGLNTVVKRKTGLNLKQTYMEVADTLNSIWQEEIESRKPFMHSESLMPKPSGYYTEYSQLEFADNYLYAIRSGMTRAAELVRIDRFGRENSVMPFSGTTSQLCFLPRSGRFYWSESIPDIRWSQKVNSKIRYYDVRHGRRRSLTREGRLFNPCPSPDESMLCVSEYHDNGRTGLAIIDASNGRRISSAMAPDSIQVVENAWIGSTVYSTGISPSGYGIYATEYACRLSGEWRTVLAPQPVQIVNFSGDEDGLHFVTDRTGVQEYYRLVPGSGELTQLTSTRYGADDFIYSPDGKTLYYSAKQYLGNLIEKTPADSLMPRKVDFSDIHRYRMADELSRQEQELAMQESAKAERTNATDGQQSTAGEVCSTPARYRKFPHLLRIHSWAPFYFNIDNIMSFSGEQLYDFISLGASALSQNDLGTAVSQFGYSAHKDPYNASRWRHSGHVKFTYSGLFPVIEASVDINDRGARVSGIASQFSNYGVGYRNLRSREYGKPYVSGSISVYIPFNFSQGGWHAGLVPKVSYTLTNDVFHTGTSTYNSIDGIHGGPFLMDMKAGKSIPMQAVVGSVRFYRIRPVAESGVYPRWGFGVETGAVFRPGLQKYYSAAAYCNIYGYLPGIIPQQGLYLKALYQTLLGKDYLFGTNLADVRPQGLRNAAGLSSYIAGHSTNSIKFSASYGIPVYIGDISVFGTFMYIKRLVVTPYLDYTMFGNMRKGKGSVERITSNGLLSAGATAAIDFGSLFWIGFPFQIGVSCCYNGGPSFESIRKSGIPMSHFFIGPVFSVSFN
ncbi:MAG: hypothetical protein NC308_03945 [Clostridium sp.]|nr:hypothetical protein [Bacteroides sp.]MCM1198020.1 hypothetical protein [Clostridium sp.]